MNKFLTSRIVAVLCLALFSFQSFAGTVTGVQQNAQGGPVANGTYTLTLTAPMTIAGTASVVTSSVNCYTDQNGNVVGEPNPLVAPVVSTNIASGTLAGGTYFTRIAYLDASGTSFAGPETSTVLSSAGSLIVAPPAKQPTFATGFKVFIGSSSGSETLQGTVTGTPGTWANFTQSVPLVAGAALPASNTTVCTLHFNDEGTPSFTCYDVGLANSVTGANIPGFPQFWYLAGGSAGTVNISSGTPQSNVCQGSGMVYPQAVLTLPPFNGSQTINGPLNLNGFGLTAGLSSFAGLSNSANDGLANSSVVKWGTDTGLSRDSAGVVDVGNGTAADKSGNIKLATLTLGKSDGTLPATFTNDTAGGINFTSNSGKTLELNTQAQLVFFGAISGTTILAPTGVASGTLTLPAATDTLIGKATTDTLTGKGFGDKIALYNNISTVSNGVASEYATVDLTAQTANIGSTPLYAVPASGAGMYRISAYVIVTSVGTTSTMPQVIIAFTDKDNNTAQSVAFTTTSAGNTLTTLALNQFPISVKASTTISYSTSGYASTGAAMQYAVHIKLEAM